jgi:serine/threonine-protein kinase
VAELQTGELITPSLKLVRHLGTGGMGTVWVARHLGLNSDVVVKFITGDFARNAEAVARFQREAGAASEVRSPHVVQVFDYGIAQNGFPYIAMELLEGEDFAARIARQHLVPAAEVAGVVVQVARALARAHEKKIVHRDIKPENLFLCETGEEEAFVKVLDFGIAKFGSPGQFGGTATGAMLGTPYFMSPEQVNDSKSIDHRTDLWSLAVVAYYAMTGVRPFDGETLVAVAMKICTGEVPPPSSLNPQLPPAVDAWFARACAKDPNARFPSARALADALVSAVGGRAVAQVMSKAASFDQEATQEFRPSMLGASGPALPARLSVPQPPIHVVSAPVQPTMLATTTGASIAAAATGDHGITVVQPRRSRVVPVILGGAAAGVLIGVIVYTVSSGGSSPRPAATGAATETADETSTATTRLPSKRPAPSETSTAEPAGSASSAVPVAPTRRPPPAGSTTAVATPPTVSTAAPTLASATTKPTATTKPPATTTRSKPTYEPLE